MLERDAQPHYLPCHKFKVEAVINQLTIPEDFAPIANSLGP